MVLLRSCIIGIACLVFSLSLHLAYAKGDFVTTWKTDNAGTSASDQITIPTDSSDYTYDYNVDWGDGNTDADVTGDITHTYATPGTYTVSINGTFPYIAFRNGGDKLKILSIEQWGGNEWLSMVGSFFGCSNLVINATDAPNLSSVTDMSDMFFGDSALGTTGDLDAWDVSNITNMNSVFTNDSSFNQPLGDWDVSNVTNMDSLFGDSGFNQDISSWKTGKVTNMRWMFYSTPFNQNIGGWDVSNVTNFQTMFYGTPFNQDISSWNTQSATDMDNMFTYDSAFNQNIGGWNTSKVTNMSGMFQGDTVFNQDIHLWDVSNVTTFAHMFDSDTSFNQNISSWNTADATDMTAMFAFATSFNQDISTWNVSHVAILAQMFRGASSFSQNLGPWSIGNVTDMGLMFAGDPISTANYDAMLTAWSQESVHSNVPLDADSSYYCSAVAAHTTLTTTYNWSITDKGKYCSTDAFITTWKTDNAGTSGNNQITIPTFSGDTYNYNVDWGDGNTDAGVTGDITHTYTTAGTYTVKISGTFPRIYFNDGGDAQKLLTIEQWGTTKWDSMSFAFAGCTNLVINATDTPDLSNLTDIGYMFFNDAAFNGPVNTWDVSHVTNISAMFDGTAFNQPLNNWDVSHVTQMGGLFGDDTVFDQDIHSWNTGNVTSMSGMFIGATAFNQPLNNWNVSKVTDMSSLFAGASSFNQPLNNWNVSNVTDMSGTFYHATAFNQPIGNWNTVNVASLGGMFNGASSFNQSLNNWNVSKVTEMIATFNGASSFNQPLNHWDVSHVTTMLGMFANATSFDQDLSSWNIGDVTDMQNQFVHGMFTGDTLSTTYYDAILNAWSQSHTPSGLVFDGGASQYCASAAPARAKLINTYGWTITDGGQSSSPSCIVVTPQQQLKNVTVFLIPSKPITPTTPPVSSGTPTPPPTVPSVGPTQQSSGFVFTKNLKKGMDDADVSQLQEFLDAHGTPVATSGWGSVGHLATLFGAKTVLALKKYQKSVNLPATGYFGPMTRAYVNGVEAK